MNWMYCLVLCSVGVANAADPADCFEIQIVDAATQRGIPLVELVTVHDVRYITDNAGRIAYSEPGHNGQTVFFRVEAQGYAVPKDGFGIEGTRFEITPGGRGTLELKRTNRAERLYRVTGQDLYRDSVMLNRTVPLREPLGSGQVAGQDSVQVARYRNKLYWFWGDTNRLSYPLGLFRTAGATSELPGPGVLPAEQGIDLNYFVDANGFARSMVDVPDREGVVWIDGLCVVEDETGTERLVAHFSRRRGLSDELEQGTLLFNDDRQLFEVIDTYPLDETWRHLADHPFQREEGGQRYLTWGNPFPTVRVPATLASILDRRLYQAWNCRTQNEVPLRDEQGQLIWNWGTDPPTTQRDEYRWLKSGDIKPDETRFVPRDIDRPQDRIQMHSGTVYWQPARQRYIMLAVQTAYDRPSPSPLGEVWIAESVDPQGPYRTATRIVSHDKQTFYNPCQHPYFDSSDGNSIYFEGTYCNSFTTAPATQRYNYNQIMYRIELPAIASDRDVN